MRESDAAKGMTGGEATVRALRAAGATHVFGLLGSTTMEVYDALYENRDVRYIGVRDERNGVHMADAFARVSGRPGVFLAGQAGPGAANMVTGLAQARLAYSPVVAITGLAATGHLGRDAFQEIDQQALFAPITKRTMTVPRADRIQEFIHEAYRVATAGRCGPVVVQIPRDLFAARIDVPVEDRSVRLVPGAGTVNRAAVAETRDLLLRARAPVVIAGGGVKWGRGSEHLARLATRLGIPVTASAGHADVLPTDHPTFFGQVGPRGNPVASRLAREADLVIALGTRLGFNTTFYTYNDLAKDAPIVQVDIEPSAIGRYFPIRLGAIGDAGTFAAALDEALSDLDGRRVAWADWLAEAQRERDRLWQARDDAGSSHRVPLSAERVFREIRSVLPRDAIVTLDAGTMCLQATDQLRYHVPPALITPLDFGLVGFSYAAGLGAKIAAPDRPVVTLMGDGGFGMSMGEINTAVQHGIVTVAVVLDNGCWGAEKAYQRDFYDRRFIGADITSPPFDQVARLSGGVGFAVDGPGQLADALSEALKADRPAVIHVKVDPDAIVSFRRDSFTHRVAR